MCPKRTALEYAQHGNDAKAVAIIQATIASAWYKIPNLMNLFERTLYVYNCNRVVGRRTMVSWAKLFRQSYVSHHVELCKAKFIVSVITYVKPILLPSWNQRSGCGSHRHIHII
eukprot:1394309-Amorphochlora_amoeboformis.AAC.1